jgi:hypothetical protein
LVDADREQTLECLTVLRGSFEVPAAGKITTEIYVADDQPRVFVRLAGEGRVPVRFRIGHSFDLSWIELAERWAAATGGLMTPKDDGASLTFADAETNSGYANLTDSLIAIGDAARQLSAWRGAGGHYEPGYNSLEETRRLYRQSTDRAHALVNEAVAKLPPV